MKDCIRNKTGLDKRILQISNLNMRISTMIHILKYIISEMLPVINLRISDVITSVKYIMSEMLPVINLRIFEMIYCLNIRISEMIPRLKRNQEKARFTCIAFPVLLI